MYTKMSSEARKRAIDNGLIQKDKDIPSKDRRYNLVCKLMGKTESLKENKGYGYCLTVQRRLEVQIQYKDAKFTIERCN